MLVQLNPAGAVHVLVADLEVVTGMTAPSPNAPSTNPVRSFATSEQLLEWLRKHPGFYRVLARASGDPIASYFYSHYEGDVLCGYTISCDLNGNISQPGIAGRVWLG